MEPIISKNCRIRCPDGFSIGDFSIVDDFCYFSTKVRVGRFCHIASGCSVAGGGDMSFTMGDCSSLSSGVKVWCSSNDYVNDIIMITPPGVRLSDKVIKGDVNIGRFCGIGANTVIMPGNDIPEGVAIGALSFVPPGFKFKPWTVYSGIPIKRIKARNRKNVLKQYQELKRQIPSGW